MKFDLVERQHFFDYMHGTKYGDLNSLPNYVHISLPELQWRTYKIADYKRWNLTKLAPLSLHQMGGLSKQEENVHIVHTYYTFDMCQNPSSKVLVKGPESNTQLTGLTTVLWVCCINSKLLISEHPTHIKIHGPDNQILCQVLFCHSNSLTDVFILWYFSSVKNTDECQNVSQ